MENNYLHHGEILKKIVKDRSMTDAEVGEILSMTRQAVMDIYKREKIKRNKLIEISELLNIDISIFGSDGKDGKDELVITLLKELVDIQRENIKLLKEKIEKLEKV